MNRESEVQTGIKSWQANVNERKSEIEIYQEEFKRRAEVYNAKAKLIGAPLLLICDIIAFSNRNILSNIHVPLGCKDGIVEIPEFVQEVTVSGQYFSLAKNLRTLKVIGGKGLISTHDMFRNSIFLSKIDLSEFSCPISDSMSRMFKNCTELRSVDLSNLDIGRVGIMREAFSGCTRLENVTFPKSEAPKLKDISHMFEGCGRLVNIDMSDFDLRSVDNMQRMFNECIRLQHIKFSEYPCYNINSLESFIGGCHALKTVDLENLYTGKLRHRSNLFSIPRGSAMCLNIPDFSESHKSYYIELAKKQSLTVSCKKQASDISERESGLLL